MWAFALSAFPPTAILGAGHFTYDQGFQSWFGWTQLATLIGQITILVLLRQATVQHSEYVDAQDVLSEPDTQYLLFGAILLLLFGLAQYMYGIWRTVPTLPQFNFNFNKKKKKISA